MINQNENSGSNSNNIQPHLLDIDKMIGHPKPKYNNIHHLDGVQNDPGGLNTTNFKQEYTVLIRKKRYYSSTSGIDNNHKYLQIIQLNNFLDRSEEHTSELQSRQYLVCRLLLEKKKKKNKIKYHLKEID